MLDPDVQISKITEDGRFERDGTRTQEIRVEFFVGKHGPFSVRIPKDSFTTYSRDEAIMNFARQVKG